MLTPTVIKLNILMYKEIITVKNKISNIIKNIYKIDCQNLFKNPSYTIIFLKYDSVSDNEHFK